MGTKLVTAYDQPALGGVYKLGAIQDAGGQWHRKLKLSDHAAKTSIPGILQVRRFATQDRFVGDMIYDDGLGIDPRLAIVDPRDPARQKLLTADLEPIDLLIPALRNGRRVAEPETLEAIRARGIQQLAMLHPSIRRFMNPHEFPAGLDIGLHELRDQMIREWRAFPVSKAGMTTSH